MKFFNLLFKNGEYICAGGLFATAVDRVENISNQPPSEFFAINPLRDSRKDSNVTALRNFLFEMDNVDVAEQLRLVQSSTVPLTTVVFSGGKSYHVIISLENDNAIKSVEQYKATWKAIANYLAKAWNIPVEAFDTACQNPSRLSRFPGFLRDTGKTQELIHVGRLWTDEQLAAVTPARQSSTVQKQHIDSLKPRTIEQMEAMMPAELRARLKYPRSWARGSAGNYPELLKIVLWIIDTTQADPDSIEALLSKKVFPVLRTMGYPENKLRKPIKDALVVKGLK